MQVFHTAGVPPSSGNTIFANIGSARNNNPELQNRVRQNSGTIRGRPTARSETRAPGACNSDASIDPSVTSDISARFPCGLASGLPF
jgi:hypothetical protein